MMYKKIGFSSLFSLLYLCSMSQQQLPEHMFYKKLTNGLEVMVLEDHTIPFTTIEIACKNGSFTESADYNGLSHLYEHMFFKSNQDYDSQEKYFKQVSDLDIHFNGSTREEVVNYYFSLPKENTIAGLEFMNSAIRFPLFKKADMRKENPIVDSEFQRQESNPYFILIDTMKHALWGDNYSRKNIIGNHEVILSATPEKMETIKNKYYHPDNCLLIVAGDVEHNLVFPEVERVFGSWPASSLDPFKEWPVPEVKPLKENKWILLESEAVGSPLLQIQWHGPDTRNDVKATYAADVFSEILNQRMSKLTQALQDSGLATNVGFNYYTQKFTGPITISLLPNPTRIRECYQVVQREISKWDSDDYFTDSQLERAKRALYVDQVEDREEVERYAHVIGFWWASATTDYYTFYYDNLNKINREDIKAYVRKYIKGKPFIAGLIVPKGLNTQKDATYYFSK